MQTSTNVEMEGELATGYTFDRIMMVGAELLVGEPKLNLEDELSLSNLLNTSTCVHQNMRLERYHIIELDLFVFVQYLECLAYGRTVDDTWRKDNTIRTGCGVDTVSRACFGVIQYLHFVDIFGGDFMQNS